MKYNPVRAWPHRRIKTFQIHNWTGYLALTVCGAHATVLLFSGQEHFRVLDLLYPLGYDKQPVINALGALAFYLVLFVVVTSYGAAAVFFVHSILTDPTLKNHPVDYFDGEKVYIEVLALVVIAAVWWRVRHRWVRHVRPVLRRSGSSPSVSPGL